MDVIDVLANPPCFKLWKFLTFWSFVLCIAAPWVYKTIDLLLLSLFVLIAGTGIFFIKPGTVRVELCNGKTMEFRNGFDKALLNLVFHVLPFVMIYACYGRYYIEHSYNFATTISCFIIMLYTLTQDWERLYNASPEWNIIYFVVALLSYVGLTKK